MTKKQLSTLKQGDRVLLRCPKEPKSAFNGAKATIVEVFEDGAWVRLGRNKREQPIIFDCSEIHLIAKPSGR